MAKNNDNWENNKDNVEIKKEYKKDNMENNKDKIESHKDNTEDNKDNTESHQDNTKKIHGNVMNNKDNMENLGSLYDAYFKSSSYLDMFRSIDNTPGIRWTLTEMTRLFSGRGTLGPGALQGVARSVIEVGSGPTPFNTGPAAAWATNIVWSDFTKSNREYLWTWLGEKGSIPPFESFFDFAAGFDEETGDVQADRLREKVAGVFFVDLHQPNPVHPLCIQGDVVFSHLVLEYVASSRVIYKNLFNNITNLIKPGGMLVLQSATGASRYFVENVMFPATSVDELFLKECVKENGLQLLEYKEHRFAPGEIKHGQQECGEDNNDHDGMYSLVATKPNHSSGINAILK